MKDIIVMCPTVYRADQEFRQLCKELGENAARIHPVERRVDILNGPRVFFKGETEGQQTLLGHHGDIIPIYKFRLEDIYDTNS